MDMPPVGKEKTTLGKTQQCLCSIKYRRNYYMYIPRKRHTRDSQAQRANRGSEVPMHDCVAIAYRLRLLHRAQFKFVVRVYCKLIWRNDKVIE